MVRPDGRATDETRKLVVKYEGLDRVDGSATFEFGETRALVSLSGPIEVRQTAELPSQATVEVHVRPLASVPGTDSRALAATLKSVISPSLFLSHHPRTLVQIVGQALCTSDSGAHFKGIGRGWYASLVASLINASSAALINASSIPMKGVVCAISVGRLQESAENPDTPPLILDPSEAELNMLSGSGCFAFLFSSALPKSSQSQSNIPPSSLLWTNYAVASGSFSPKEFERALELATSGAERVWQALKNSLQPREEHPKPQRIAEEVQNALDDEKMEI